MIRILLNQDSVSTVNTST